jgi:ABC-type Fe3+/spermidine/putrescine transport system ATPase subunit
VKIEFKGITKKYGAVTAVEDLNLTIESGALHFLLGPSGCGKTTTLRMLAGLETPTSGQILFDGRDVTALAAADRGIGMVFQNYALWPHMTVRENAAYALKIKGMPQSKITEEVNRVLEVAQLAHLSSRLPGQLSGGQQQRVALARAMVIHPNVLLLDEPLSNLDAKLRLEMRDNISSIHKKTGITTVYVTHDQKEALSMGTQITVMKNGHLGQTARPRDLYDQPDSAFIASFIGETNLIEGTIKELSPTIWLVDTPIGLLRAAPARHSAPVNDRVTLSIRPEAIRLEYVGDGARLNHLAMVLDHLTYLGESEQLTLRAPGPTKRLIRSSLFHSSARHLDEGHTLNVAIAPEDVLVLPFEAQKADA